MVTTILIIALIALFFLLLFGLGMVINLYLFLLSKHDIPTPKKIAYALSASLYMIAGFFLLFDTIIITALEEQGWAQDPGAIKQETRELQDRLDNKVDPLSSESLDSTQPVLILPDNTPKVR